MRITRTRQHTLCKACGAHPLASSPHAALALLRVRSSRSFPFSFLASYRPVCICAAAAYRIAVFTRSLPLRILRSFCQAARPPPLFSSYAPAAVFCSGLLAIFTLMLLLLHILHEYRFKHGHCRDFEFELAKAGSADIERTRATRGTVAIAMIRVLYLNGYEMRE